MAIVRIFWLKSWKLILWFLYIFSEFLLHTILFPEGHLICRYSRCNVLSKWRWGSRIIRCI